MDSKEEGEKNVLKCNDDDYDVEKHNDDDDDDVEKYNDDVMMSIA